MSDKLASNNGLMGFPGGFPGGSEGKESACNAKDPRLELSTAQSRIEWDGGWEEKMAVGCRGLGLGKGVHC